MAAGTGSLGPDCFFTFIGTAKYLPNPDGSRGKHCTKGNVELTGSGPGCALGEPFETIAGRQLGRLHLQRRRHLV